MYLSDDIYVEIITDAKGFTATQIEISLSRTLSLLSQFGIEQRHQRQPPLQQGLLRRAAQAQQIVGHSHGEGGQVAGRRLGDRVDEGGAGFRIVIGHPLSNARCQLASSGHSA